MKKFIPILIIFLISAAPYAKAQKYEAFSPDKNITLTVQTGETTAYSVNYKNKPLISPSVIGMTFQSGMPAVKGVKDAITEYEDGAIIPVVREKRAVIPNIYTQLTIQFKNQSKIQFRVYNDAVAYRFITSNAGEIIVTNETASFNFVPGTIIHFPQVTKRSDADIFHTAFEENYTTALTDTLNNSMFAFTPVLLQKDDLPKVLITESDVNDYPGMFLTKTDTNGIAGIFAHYPIKEEIAGGEFKQKLVTERAAFIAKTKGTRNFPWRIIAIAPQDADLLVNDVVYRLAPDASFSDYSWIKPGKSTEEWITGLNLSGVEFITGLNTETYKYYIDFAVRFGFQYVMLDAGWSDVNDLFKITPGMDMEEITRYAKEKGIGLILWTQALTIERQMDAALQQFKKWDIKIVMTDFIDRNDQVAINFLHRFASECARYKFMCMIHGAPNPAGFTRTWPNMLARESVLGSEYNAWSSRANPEHDLILPFIRMVAGPLDYEPGLLQNATKSQTVKMGFEKVIAQGTTMHQISMFVVYESPLQLFSGNLSDAVKVPDLMELLGKIPTTWDETIILNAEFGKYIVEARRNGNNWYIAAINDWTPQEFSIPLKFLKDGNYLLESASDGINAAKNPQDYKMNNTVITQSDSLRIKLAPGGGFVGRIYKK